MKSNDKLAIAQVSRVMDRPSIATTAGYYQRGAHLDENERLSGGITTTGYFPAEPDHHKQVEST